MNINGDRTENHDLFCSGPQLDIGFWWRCAIVPSGLGERLQLAHALMFDSVLRRRAGMKGPVESAEPCLRCDEIIASSVCRHSSATSADGWG